MTRFGIVLFGIFAAIIGVVILALGGGFFYLRSSLPPLSGERVVEGIVDEVVIERDTLGVPVIRAASLDDVIFGQGYVHGQDRFFQMDLLRRTVTGEMAALLGGPALEIDLRYRPYGYRRAAEFHLANLDPENRELLEIYAAGVNAGLASLGRRPPEYAITRSTPQPWEAIDTILGQLYFYIALSTHYQDELHLRTLYDVLPNELADFLTPDDSRFDAPVIGANSDDPTGGYRPRPIPGPGIIDVRESPSAYHPAPEAATDGLETAWSRPGGSNAWAVLGEDGRTLLANDPHLPLSVPGMWYRVDLRWEDRRVAGVSPPGFPGVYAGSSESLAWGVTAALLDQTDLVEIELHPDDSLLYRVPEGWDTLRTRSEMIVVRGDEDAALEVVETRWGPVLYEGHDGVPLALRSSAFEPGGVTMRHFGTLRNRTLDDMMAMLGELGGFGLSIVIADDDGRIGWRVAGAMPRRQGFSGRRPVSFAAPGVGWNGMRDEAERPTIVLEESGTLHTANQRLLPLPESRELSYLWMPPFRARRIANRLDAGLASAVPAHHALQLDTRSLLHDPLRDIALAALSGDELEPRLDSVRTFLEEWDGTADAEEPHFRIMVRVGSQLMEAVLAPLLAPAREIPGFRYTWPLSHEPALRILEERPPHLLPGGHEDWDTFLLAEIRGVAERLSLEGSEGLATPWGVHTETRIRHPFGEISPALGRFLNLVPRPISGWSGTVRAQLPDHGQSFRMVVRPGDFEGATFQMPAGQSGHPFSRFYRAGHDAWLEGAPAPMAPGPPQHTLTLRPPA